VEASGLKVWNISNNDNRNIEEITLDLPGRDAKMAWLKQYIRDTARRGSATSRTPTWPTDLVERAGQDAGGATGAVVPHGDGEGHWNGKVYQGALTHGRKYSKEELWENYTWFIRQIAPVAEEAACASASIRDDPAAP
jgi:mannonate dehydratase